EFMELAESMFTEELDALKNKLNSKQWQFVCLLAQGDKTPHAACIEAGYSEKSATEQVRKLLRNKYVVNARRLLEYQLALHIGVSKKMHVEYLLELRQNSPERCGVAATRLMCWIR
ncbi:unnamed protein product, partial [marine sediment metagenome]